MQRHTIVHCLAVLVFVVGLTGCSPSRPLPEEPEPPSWDWEDSDRSSDTTVFEEQPVLEGSITEEPVLPDNSVVSEDKISEPNNILADTVELETEAVEWVQVVEDEAVDTVALEQAKSYSLPEPWFTDFDEAIKIAIQDNKDLYVMFMGQSYKGVLYRENDYKQEQQAILKAMTSATFVTQAQEHFVLVYLDCEGRAGNLSFDRVIRNQELADKYAFHRSFLSDPTLPSVGIVSDTGESLYQTDSEMFDVQELLEGIQERKSESEHATADEPEPEDDLVDYNNLWHTDLETAKKEAQKSQRDILLVVTDPEQSRKCNEMESRLFADKTGFLKPSTRFVLVKLDLSAVRTAVSSGSTVDIAWLRSLELITVENQLKSIDSPHIHLLDKQGRICGGFTCGSIDSRDTGTFMENVTELEDARVKRDVLIDQANAAQGMASAKLLDEALDAIYFSWRKSVVYEDLIERIIALDPDNEAGLRDQYRLDLLRHKIETLVQQQQWGDVVTVLDAYFACHPTDVEAMEPYLYRFHALCQLQRLEDAVSAADDYLERYEPKEFTDFTRLLSERALTLRALKMQLLMNLGQWAKVVTDVDDCLSLYRYKLDNDTKAQLCLSKSQAWFQLGQVDKAEDALYEAPSSYNKEVEKTEAVLTSMIHQARVHEIRTSLTEQSVSFSQYNGRTITPGDFNDLTPEAQYSILKNEKNDELRMLYVLSLNQANNKILRDYTDKQSVNVSSDQQELTPEQWKQVNYEYRKVQMILDLSWEQTYWSRQESPYVDMFLPNDWRYTQDPNRLPDMGIFFLKPEYETEYDYPIEILISWFADSPVTVEQYQEEYESWLNLDETIIRQETLSIRSVPAFGYDIKLDTDERTLRIYRVHIPGPLAGLEIQCIADSSEGLNHHMPLIKEFIRRLIVHGIPESAVEPQADHRMRFVKIQAGEFMMGSDPNDPMHEPGETRHRVRLTQNYYMQTTEVTQKQWLMLMDENPSSEKGDNLPVDRVNWDDVKTFIERLNAQEGTDKYRLPTEAEWEYACRAGSTATYCFGDDANNLGDYAWYQTNSNDTIHPVASKEPNRWGLYDMHGNVCEWCQDWYVLEYYESSPTDNPLALPSDASSQEEDLYSDEDTMGPWDGRIQRGGQYFISANGCRSANRSFYPPSWNETGCGFRLCYTDTE